METQIQIKKNSIKINKLVLFFIALVFLSNSKAQSFKKKLPSLGMTLGTHISGNGHGVFYDLSGSVYLGKSTISVGPSIQNHSNVISGGHLYFSYTASKKNSNVTNQNSYERKKNIQLFFFSYLQYVHNAKLGINTVKTEEALVEKKDLNKIDYNKVKISTIDVCVGFGLSCKLSKNVFWKNHIGVGAFYHTKFLNEMNTDKTSPTIALGSSIAISF